MTHLKKHSHTILDGDVYIIYIGNCFEYLFCLPLVQNKIWSALLPFSPDLLCPGVHFVQDVGYIYHCTSRENWEELIPVF